MTCLGYTVATLLLIMSAVGWKHHKREEARRQRLTEVERQDEDADRLAW